jgi:hypothetical protein
LSCASWSAIEPRCRFHERSTATVVGSMSMTRGLHLFVGPSCSTPFLPLTRTMLTDRRTLIVPASKSMSRHLSASDSPRRMQGVAAVGGGDAGGADPALFGIPGSWCRRLPVRYPVIRSGRGHRGAHRAGCAAAARGDPERDDAAGPCG